MVLSSEVVPNDGYSRTARKSLIVDGNGSPISVANPLPTTASISGDVYVDSTSISVQAYVGKPLGTNADFVTLRTAATTFTCATLPSGVTSIKTEDIELIRQINATGTVVASYSRDDAVITCSGNDPTTVTVTGAAFGATDSIILYTNIYKPITTVTPSGVSSVVLDADGQVKATSGVVYAVHLSFVGVTAGDKIEIKNSTDNSGTSLITLVAPVAAGSIDFCPCVGSSFSTGIYLDETKTGGTFTATVVYA